MLLSSFVISHSSFAADPSPKPKTSPSPTAPPQVEKISDNVFKVGEVTLDKSTKTVSFHGAINMDQGNMEYLLVQKGGKTH
ncbi:MAG TPA: hypothetical protein VG733_03215, partial [Chthoniobacteraceae bacterium]|nr:hypothetical protein [Chthoniobacteraceae bacterium]